MLQILMILGLLLPLSGAEGAGVAGGPCIVDRDTAPRLHMPPAMWNALRDFDPRFKPRQWGDYSAWAREEFPATDRQALFAVVGDFNGDDVDDVMVEGDSVELGRLLAILSDGTEWRIVEESSFPSLQEEIRRWRNEPDQSDRLDFLHRSLFLQKPGKLESRYEDESLVLEHDAVYEAVFEKGGAVLFWDGTQFRRYTMAD